MTQFCVNKKHVKYYRPTHPHPCLLYEAGYQLFKCLYSDNIFLQCPQVVKILLALWIELT